jgi:hypothetical protein
LSDPPVILTSIKKVKKVLTKKGEQMFSLKYKVELDTNPRYPLSREFSTCLGVLMNTEQDANEYLDALAQRGTILEVELVELKDYKPSKYVPIATTRSWER